MMSKSMSFKENNPAVWMNHLLGYRNSKSHFDRQCQERNSHSEQCTFCFFMIDCIFSNREECSNPLAPLSSDDPAIAKSTIGTTHFLLSFPIRPFFIRTWARNIIPTTSSKHDSWHMYYLFLLGHVGCMNVRGCSVSVVRLYPNFPCFHITSESLILY